MRGPSLLLGVVLPLVACSGVDPAAGPPASASPASPASSGEAVAAAPPAPGLAPPGPPPGAASPGAASPGLAQSPPGGLTVRGKVLERIDASGYSYLRLATSEGERWAAVPETTQQVGAEVTVTGGMPMDGFQSKTLKRRFDRIVFGVLAGADARGAALRPGAMGSGSYHGRRSGEALLEPIDIATIQVPRAPGEDGYTLAELYAKRRTLQDREIQVRGKVIKVTESVMGRNWVHLADGTGSGRARDLTLTTQDSALVGDVVLARGLLRIDRDFGAGYTYPLILEDARLSR